MFKLTEKPLFLVFAIGLLINKTFCFTKTSAAETTDDSEIKLEVSSDAPGLVGAPIGFNVKLLVPKDNSSVYDYVFEAFGPRKRHKWEMNNESVALNATFAFHEAGDYKMQIRVKTDTIEMLAKTSFKFSVFSRLIGAIKVDQPGVYPPNPNLVSTKTEANITFVVYDPRDFLNDTVKIYGWSINGRPPEESSGSSLRYNFTESRTYYVALMVTFVNSSDPTISYYNVFSLVLTARDPIENYNISGKTSIKHGDLLELEVSCEGSPPYSYCWHFRQEEVNKSTESCVDPTMTTDCEFLVIRYFRKSGNYKLVVILDNDIEHQVDVININVFDSAPEPQLSPIIVPLVCTCLALGIIVIGIMYYVQTRRQNSIEVADFDFQLSDTYEFRTFYRRLRDSLREFFSKRKERQQYTYRIIHAQVT